MKDDQIDRIQLYRAVTLLERPISDATHKLDEISFLVLRVTTQSGIMGEGYLLRFQYAPNSIIGAIKDVSKLAKNFTIWETVKFNQNALGVDEYFGNTGLLNWARCLFNIAMWDAKGKYLGQPIHRIFGINKEKIPIYGSGGWLSYSIKELLSEVVDYKDRGFSGVKIKVGSSDLKIDLDRLLKVREAVGSEIKIMMDANQGMNPDDAIQLALAARDLNIFWFEEPIHHKNYDGYKKIKERSGISLAMGEREFDTVGFRELLLRNAIDIWQPDLLRLGSVEAWRESAALASCFHIPVLPHYYKDYDVPLLCTIPNAASAESFDWIDKLIDHPIRIENGFAYPREAPGWGFTFLDDCLEEIIL
jgi:L-alanine-DL-glutamate epimerase-like enolase superfamily enzyme